MLPYTNYLPALPRMHALERISTSECWPSEKTIMTYARAWFVYSCRPARPFPAANFCPLAARPKPKPLRISTEQIPALTLSAWQEQQQDWHAYERAPRDVARPPEPAPTAPRKHARAHAFLDRLIAWRRRQGQRPR